MEEKEEEKEFRRHSKETSTLDRMESHYVEAGLKQIVAI